MNSRKALVVGIHHWESPLQVGSHAIARELAAMGWTVGYVSAPVTPFHWLRPAQAGFRERLGVHRGGGMIDRASGIWHYVPFSLIAPDHRAGFNARWVFERWQMLSRPALAKHVAAQGFGDVDLLLLNSHFQPFWLDAVRFRRSVYRLADLTAGFAGCGPSALEVEKSVARRVDLVVTAAHSLVEPARSLGAGAVMAMPNGIRNQDFGGSAGPLPVEYRGINGPIAVYVGAFGPWVDVGLIERAAALRPDMHFMLIGPEDGLHGRIATRTNLRVLGPKSRSDLKAYLRHAHVGLMPFNRDACPELVDHVHPLKLYEYLACGLPVISTDWAEMRAFEHPATLCRNADEFVRALPLDCTPDPRAAEFRSFAAAADWTARIGTLVERVAL